MTSLGEKDDVTQEKERGMASRGRRRDNVARARGMTSQGKRDKITRGDVNGRWVCGKITSREIT